MATLIIADHDNAKLAPAMPSLVTAARLLGGPVTVLVAGHDCDAAAQASARLHGVETVLVADSPHLERQLAEPMADLVVSLADRFDAIAALAGSSGKNLMPRVAALLDVMQLSDVIEVKAPDTFVRPTYAGNVHETVRSRDTVRIVTVRGTAFQPAAAADAAAPVLSIPAPGEAGPSRFVGEALSQSGRPELASARIVVSGGRAFGSRENFDRYLQPLAEKLGAAIGASRAAVDSGYASNDLQVGQTGKVVAPDLYIACGISGAVQHLAGMKDARCIVAINRDADAPIFQVADYGLVGDVFEILPELTDKL